MVKIYCILVLLLFIQSCKSEEQQRRDRVYKQLIINFERAEGKQEDMEKIIDRLNECCVNNNKNIKVTWAVNPDYEDAAHYAVLYSHFLLYVLGEYDWTDPINYQFSSRPYPRNFSMQLVEFNEREKLYKIFIIVTWHDDSENIVNEILNKRNDPFSDLITRCNIPQIKERCFTHKETKVDTTTELWRIISYKRNVEYEVFSNINILDAPENIHIFNEINSCMEKAIDDYYIKREVKAKKEN